MKTKITRILLLIALFSSTLISAIKIQAQSERYTIFADGTLAEGAQLVNGRVNGNSIVTDMLATKGWAKPRFEIRGLNIDIRKVNNLKQIKLRMVVTDGNAPSYSDIVLFNSEKQQWYLTNFPFRAYDRSDPLFMTKGFEHTNHYGKMPAGKHYGSITGLGVNVGQPVSMKFSRIELIIDSSAADIFPDDPKPDPSWSNGQIKRVYAVSVSERIFQDDLNSPYANNNPVFNNGTIVLDGARRETVSFQLVIETEPGLDGLNDVNVVFNGVTNDNHRIDNSKAKSLQDPYNYVDKPIQLYRSRYIKMPDKVLQFVNKEVAKVADTFGRFTPAMQIPFEAEWGGAPFAIFPGKTQSVLIDIVIPEQTKAGRYQGSIDVLVKEKMISSLPVYLQVHDFALPNKPSITSFMFAGHAFQQRHGVTGVAAERLVQTYHQFYRRHHTNMQMGSHCEPGSTYTSEHSYEGRGYGLEPDYCFLTFYGLGDLKRERNQNVWNAALTDLYKKGANIPKSTKRVLYLWDEPSHSFQGGIPAFNQWVATIASFVEAFDQQNQSNTLLYATTHHHEVGNHSKLDAYGYRTLKEHSTMKANGRETWLYNGPRTYQDYVSGPRIIGWKAFQKKADVWWMWESTEAPNGFDFYHDAINFTNQYGEQAAGDGLFIFPGTDKLIEKRNPGLNGPVAGLRFFNWRQGFIDYEYLVLAHQRDPAATDAIVNKLVAEASLGQGLPNHIRSAGYPKDNSNYAWARKKLVEIISAPPL